MTGSRTCSTCTRGPDRLLGGRLERRRAVPYPPVEVVARGDLRRLGRRRGGPRAAAGSAGRGRGAGHRLPRERVTSPTGELSGDMSITEVDELVAGPVSRVIIRDPTATADDFVELAARSGCTAPTTSSAGPPGSTWRGRGLEGVRSRDRRRRARVDQADVLAIGDGRNDIEMLEWAGRGVAMGQSMEEVREPPTPSPTASTTTGPRPSSHSRSPGGRLPQARRDRPRRHAVRSDGTVSQYDRTT